MISENWLKLENRLKKFWQSGDEIICTRIFRRSNNHCYLCGHTPIEWHHVLLNSISNETIDVEFSCVINMKKILEEWGSEQKILFFPKYAEEAKHLNSQYQGTSAMLEFNTNLEVIIQLLSRPKDLSYKQLKLILDHTIRFNKGVEAEVFHTALDIYVERKYYIYDMLDAPERTGNVEESIENHFRREWEEVQAEESEYQRALYYDSPEYEDEPDNFDRCEDWKRGGKTSDDDLPF